MSSERPKYKKISLQGHRSDENWISVLTEETCNPNDPLITRGEFNSRLIDRAVLFEYFFNKTSDAEGKTLENYIQENNLQQFFYPLSYNEETKCYELIINQKRIDIPSNWGVLAEFAPSPRPYLLLTKVNDHDFLIESLSELKAELVGLILLKNQKNIQMISITDISQVSEHLDFLDEYYQLKNFFQRAI